MADEFNRRAGTWAAVVVLGVGAVLTSASVLASEAQPTIVEHRDIIYLSPGGHDLQLDVYSVESGRRPTPVWIHIHGGAWWKGARPHSWTGFSAYLEAGFSVVTVQYRLAGVASAPAAVQDVRCAMSWVGKNAERYGFDTQRIVVTGTSAGGHLALMGGMLTNGNDVDLPECRESPLAAAIVDFYGPTDLDTWPAPDPDGGFKQAPHGSIARWLGANAGDSAMRKRMSPVSHVRADLPPIFIVHGDADPVVPLQESLSLKQKLDAAGARSALHVVPGGVHGKFDAERRRAIEQDVLSFLRQHGVIEE
ncbi:alpha/beta hydrolase [Steroidobacter sp. S1-65]|uniref:Alpha/beta hydrolase n=1 Tax=Steroidobacter gossypii TaxID=2805490 RepID=A0ABS1X4D9_9GAMM|nr:alpha/beta hydrolase [Steroidobacter gossypii]MBM0108085.1 alpha/beta hydrolase [Steroidobacter gossypii]